MEENFGASKIGRKTFSIYGIFPSSSDQAYQRFDRFLWDLPLLDKEPGPFKFILNSNGGYDGSMFALLNVMQALKSEIHMLVANEACSAAAIVFINGTAGHRYLFRNSRVMLHLHQSCCCPELESGFFTRIFRKFFSKKPAESLEDEADKLVIDMVYRRTKGKILEILGDWRNASEKEKIDGVRSLLEDDCWFDAEEAIKFGVADRIIDSNELQQFLSDANPVTR